MDETIEKPTTSAGDKEMLVKDEYNNRMSVIESTAENDEHATDEHVRDANDEHVHDANNKHVRDANDVVSMTGETLGMIEEDIMEFLPKITEIEEEI